MEEPAPRMFWPKEIWGKYAEKLDEFKEPENVRDGIACATLRGSNSVTIARSLLHMSWT
mgnify:CR=1 FL=1